MDRKFWMQWILCNGLAYGIGVGIPIILADLQSTQNYARYIGAAFIFLGFWVGLPQWLVLRQKFLIQWQWVRHSILATFLSLPLFVLLAPKLGSSKPLLIFGIYPLLLSLSQWLILRRRFKPAWSWIVIGFIALVAGGFLGVVLGVASHQWLKSTYGISALVGGLTCGLIYGLITGLGLRHVTQQKHISSQPGKGSTRPGKESTRDTPPGQKMWVDTLISLLPLLVIMGGWFLFLPPWPSSGPSKPLLLLVPLGIFYIYTYLSVFVHELGHFLFAWATGSEIHRFAIGRFILIRTDQGLKLRRCQRQLAGGFVQTIPKSLHRLDRQLFIMIMGGPTASFLLFCVGAIPLLSPALISNNPIVWWFTFISSLSLHTAVFNTIPIKIGYLSTDGRRMLDLVQKNLAGQRFLALYRFNANLHKGIRPRDIDPDIKNQLLALPENSMEHVAGLLIAYCLTLDQGEIQQAGDYLDQALKINAYYPELFRGSLLLEGAYFEAHIRHQPDVARQWLDQIQEKVLIEPLSLLRAEAAIFLAEGDTASAQAKAQEGLAITQRQQFMPGFILFEQERLQALIQDMTHL